MSWNRVAQLLALNIKNQSECEVWGAGGGQQPAVGLDLRVLPFGAKPRPFTNRRGSSRQKRLLRADSC